MLNQLMDLTLLQELQEKLMREKDLSVIWEYYMDHFADLPELVDVSQPKRHKFLESLVPQICQQIFGMKVRITDLLVVTVAEYYFYHAPFFADGRIGGLIYFEDVNMGMLAVAADNPPSGLMHYSRFSISPLKPSQGFGRR
jgi:hypothetical protein